MKTYCFANKKGGCSKTTLNIETAFYLALQGKKTIIIDGDPQGNATERFNLENFDNELVDVLQGNCYAKEAIIKTAEYLDIIPTNKYNSKYRDFADMMIHKEPHIFSELVEVLSGMDYNYCFIDINPSDSNLERSILGAVDEIISPVQPQAFSFTGVDSFIDFVESIKKQFRKNIQFNKIVISMLDNRIAGHNVMKEKLESLPNYKTFLFHDCADISNSQIVSKSVFEFAPQSRSTEEIKSIAESLR